MSKQKKKSISDIQDEIEDIRTTIERWPNDESLDAIQSCVDCIENLIRIGHNDQACKILKIAQDLVEELKDFIEEGDTILILKLNIGSQDNITKENVKKLILSSGSGYSLEDCEFIRVDKDLF